MSDLVNNTTVTGEQLPTTNRTLNFRVTVRDNQSGGGRINSDDTQVFCTTPLLSYQSPTNAMVYNQPGSCDYKESGNPNGPGNSGNVTMNIDVAIPALAAVAELSWFDTVTTEDASNVGIYSVDISTDGGSNWTALFADSLTDEEWNQEFVNYNT